MLEKLAEMVREEVKEAGFSVEVPCIACDRRPQGSDACSSDNYCANVETPDGSLMLARWAVLLVAKALESWEEYEKAGIEYERAVQEWEKARGAGAPMDEVVCAKDKAFAQWTELDGMVMTELINLIAEAREGGGMSEVDELIERLNSAYAPKSIFQRDVMSAMQRQVKEGQRWSVLSSDIADGLTELGYVKVVRCGECKWWTKVEGRDYGWCDELFSLLTADMPYTDKDFYCSQGERKEDTNDAV